MRYSASMIRSFKGRNAESFFTGKRVSGLSADIQQRARRKLKRYSMLANIPPGEVLLEEFLQEYGISQNRLGREIGMSPRAVNEIVHGKRSITANSALRIAKFFDTSPEFWLNLQTSYDLEEAAKTIDLKHIKSIEAA